MKDLIATYYFRTKDGVDASYAANAIREEQTTGTWTSLSTVNDKTAYVHDLDGSVEDLVELPDGGYLTRICFPHEIFEKGNIPQYLSVIAGNLFGLGKLEAVRLLDIDLPENLCGCGPKFGIEGVRRIVGTEVSGRPHIGTIIKPKVGLNPKDTAQVAYEAALGGLDLIKDDETLTNQTFCPLFERLEAVMDALDRAKDETGKQVLYAVNVTTGGDRIVELAHKAVSAGANMLMVDVLTAGFSAIQGAMVLCGAETDNFEKTMIKLQSAMAIVQGLQGLEGLQDRVTGLVTSIKTATKVMGKGGWIGTIIAVVTAITALITHLTIKNKKIKDGTKALEDYNKASKATVGNYAEEIKEILSYLELEDIRKYIGLYKYYPNYIDVAHYT